MSDLIEFLIKPNPNDSRLTQKVTGKNQNREKISMSVTVERPLTLFLNSQEIVTMMSICDHPKYLAIGYLVNQNMILPDDKISSIDYDEEIETVVVRTDSNTNFEAKLQKKTLTSGCAQGTVFGDLMEKFDKVQLSRDLTLKTSELYTLIKKINMAPSLYLEAGAIHGCVLCDGPKPVL